ncbi:ATP-binding Cassette (ABC) Superfamily, partial [Thraustotheca clavata]
MIALHLIIKLLSNLHCIIQMEEQNYNTVLTPRSSSTNCTKITNSKQKTIPIYKLFSYADATDKLLLTIGIVTAMATGTSQPLLVLFFGDVINALSPQANPSTFEHDVNAVVLKFMYVGCGVLITAFLQVVCWNIAASRQSKRLRQAYAEAIFRQEIGWFDVNEPMQLASKIAETSLVIQNGIGRKVGDCITYMTMGLSSFGLALSYGWQLSLVLFACTPFVLISTYFMTKAITEAIQSSVDAYAEAGAIAEEALGNIKTVHMLSAITTIEEKYKAALQKTQISGIRRGLAVGLGTGSMYFANIATYGVGLYYGMHRIVYDRETNCTGDGCYNGGHVLIIFFCVVLGAIALGQASPSIQAISAGRAAAQDIHNLIARVSAIDVTKDDKMSLDVVKGQIQLNNITFSYPSRPDVVVCKGYSLTIPAGQKIALVGQSGSGKSTIVALLERYYDPISGQILLDGHDLQTIKLSDLRRHIGLVSQEPNLFADTIANNILRGKPTAAIEEVYNAAKQANAYDFIMSFADGFQTLVGDHGAQLSGGQKQRIAIARAIIRDPSILIFDEATSALDIESEQVVQASLDALVAMRQRTTIIIAHRLSTIRGADRIVVLNNGVIVEDGDHDQLVSIPNGHYAKLVQSQTQSSDECNTNKTTSASNDTRAFTTETKNQNGEVADVSIDASPASLMRIWRYGRPEWRHYVLGGIGALFHGAVYPLWGLLFVKVLLLFYREDLTGDELKHKALLWGAGFLVLGAVSAIAISVQNHQFAIASERLTSRVRALYFSSMLRQDMAWFDDKNHTSGALATRLASDVSVVNTMTTATLNAVLVTFASFLLAFIIAFFYSWRMTLILLVVIPFLAFSGLIELKTVSDTDKSANSGDVLAGALLSEAISSIRTVVSFGLEYSTTQHHAVFLQQSNKQDVNWGVKSGLANGTGQSLMLFCQGFAFYIGGILMNNGSATFEEVMTVFSAIFFASNSISVALQGLSDIGKAKNSIRNIFHLLDQYPTIDATSTTGDVLNQVDGLIQLENIAFAYPTRPDNQVYTNYNLTIQSGQTIALVGGSGSGKSTAISLIQRFYDPSAGRVLVDGHDLRNLNVNEFRSHISVVSQEPVLFTGTIADNIAL